MVKVKRMSPLLKYQMSEPQVINVDNELFDNTLERFEPTFELFKKIS